MMRHPQPSHAKNNQEAFPKISDFQLKLPNHAFVRLEFIRVRKSKKRSQHAPRYAGDVKYGRLLLSCTTTIKHAANNNDTTKK